MEICFWHTIYMMFCTGNIFFFFFPFIWPDSYFYFISSMLQARSYIFWFGFFFIHPNFITWLIIHLSVLLSTISLVWGSSLSPGPVEILTCVQKPDKTGNVSRSQLGALDPILSPGLNCSHEFDFIIFFLESIISSLIIYEKNVPSREIWCKYTDLFQLLKYTWTYHTFQNNLSPELLKCTRTYHIFQNKLYSSSYSLTPLII